MFELRKVRITEIRIMKAFCRLYQKKFKLHGFELDRFDCISMLTMASEIEACFKIPHYIPFLQF